MVKKKPSHRTKPKRKVPKRPGRRPKNPRGGGSPDGGTWVEAQTPKWLERKNAPGRGRKGAVKKRGSAKKSLGRFRARVVRKIKSVRKGLRARG